MKISIIMPVYNAQSTVQRMLDSIKNQTLSDFEVLMINDGCTDSSGKILDEYACADARFKVFHKPNGGVSSARQYGLERAKGEYVIHADSDDWIEPTMLEELYSQAKKDDADVVICDFYYDKGSIQQYVRQQPTTLSPLQVMRDLFQQLHGSCCNKLVKRACYNKFNAQFFSGIDYCEDLFFWYQIFSHLSVKISYLNKAYYHYYCPIGHSSIMGNYNKKFLKMGDMLVNKMEEVLPAGDLKDEAIRRFKISQKCGAFEHPIYTAEEYYDIYPECNKYMYNTQQSKINGLLVWLSFQRGFYRIATSLYKLKNIISQKRVR